MKNAIFLGALAIVASTSLRAQGPVDWNTAGNFSLNPLSSFLGTTDGVPINFRTNNILRMRLTESLPGQVIGTYTNENLSGNLGIGAFTSPNVSQPFSLLHLDNGGSQFSGYRLWQRNGVTFTGNGDQAYIGQKYKGNDNTDFVVQWSTAPSSFQLL